MLWSGLIAHLLLLCSLWTASVFAVKRNDFKTCAQSGFCSRNRALADRAAAHAKEWSSPYTLGELHPQGSTSSFAADLKNNLFPDINFSLLLDFTDDGHVRVRVDEVQGLRQRFNEAADWTLVATPALADQSKIQTKLGSKQSEFKYGINQNQRLVMDHAPLKLTFERDGQQQIVLNERGLFNMEHFRRPSSEADQNDQPATDERHQKARQAYPHFLPENEDGMWSEKWSTHTDSKPKGPESLSMDITFPGYEHVMGIPEHAGPLSLKTTRGGDNAYTDPYRLFNLDVFEYEPDSEMALYGAIPFMQAHRPGSSAAVFWLNGAESWIDITKSSSRRKTTTSTQWISEAGIMDLFVFMGSNPSDILKDYTALVGRTAMPQYFAIGYHQCRWNYLNEEDVLTVVQRFDEEDMPLDVIWLDIEYATDHKYFDWNKNNFPTPKKMLSGLADTGRQLVAIVDPHIKRVKDFYIYKEAGELDILLKNKDGKEYEGWCWPGSSSWVDFFDPKSWKWWISQFKFSKWTDSARNLWIWNDMNEPAIFNGPEMTAPKDTLYNSGWENRDLHNINGVLFHNLTAQALIEREDYPRRPFVLSRSFWTGSQRFGAIWTGDNLGTWKHLASASPMILANGVGGMAWSGADIGGFFGNPTPDMLVRWYQAGAFHPFFRAHAHIDTKRREPYLYDEPIKTHLKNMLKLRYSLLPMWYTAFWDSHRTGAPIAMPNYILFPEDPVGIAVDDQYYVGQSGLLVKPIVEEDVTRTDIYVPDDQPYYNYFTHDVYFGSSKTGSRFPFPAPLDVLPLFHRGGSIVPRRETIRRSAPLMWRDPISLVVAVDNTQSAQGSLYLDDGDSYKFEKGDFVWRGFSLHPSGKALQLTNRDLTPKHQKDGLAALELYSADNQWATKVAPVQVSDITILGLASKPSCIRSSVSKEPFTFDWTSGVAATVGRKKSGQAASRLVIRGISLPIISDWKLDIEFSGQDCEVPASYEPEPDLQSPLCPPNHFRCQNKGHMPACLLISRVNDGLCEPECCDGSDEFDGKVRCPNRCKEIGNAYRQAREEENRKARVGASTRAEYVKFGQKARAAAEKAVADLTKEVALLEAKERAAKKAVDQAEATSQEDIQRKKESTIYRRIEDYQATLRSLRLDRQQLQTELEDLYAILTELRGGYNPNYQDMAVKGAVKGFEEWAKSHGYTFADSEDAEDNTPLPEPDHESPAEEEVKKMEEEDILALLDASGEIIPASTVDATAGLFRLEDYLPHSLKPHYVAFLEQLLGFLRSIGALSGSHSDTLGARPDVVKARSALTDAESKTKKARKNLDKEKESLNRDWGTEWEWKKLDGTCLETNAGEYTYELCFFGASKQKSNKGGANVNLGKFKSWRPNTEAGSPEAYTQQIYDRGTKCWNGPERSTIVEIACGTKNEILSVMELEKCEYQFKIKSPAVCSIPEEEASSSGKDEL